MTATDTIAALTQLVSLFHQPLERLGQFRQVPPADVPPPYDGLLVHHHHMTVNMEQFYSSPVDLRVVHERTDGDLYAREILLQLQSTGQIVQYGIVQLALDALPTDVRTEIQQRGTPLGRLLIQHDVMRDVELTAVWQVQPGVELAKLLDLPSELETYGRSAVIHVDSRPVIRLLEVAAPIG